MNTYTPKPLDTSDVVLPSTLTALMERLAENAHEVWAKQRFDQGWTYGEARDDAGKKHPCLVPYDQLPEVEKDYDRKAAGETLKMILKLGYRIVEPPTTSGELGAAVDAKVLAVLTCIDAAAARLAGLMAIWQERGTERDLWEHTPELYRRFGERVL